MRALWKSGELDRHTSSATQTADPLEHEERRAVPGDELRRFEGDRARRRRTPEGLVEAAGGRQPLGEVPSPFQVDAERAVGTDLHTDLGVLRAVRTRAGPAQAGRQE